MRLGKSLRNLNHTWGEEMQTRMYIANICIQSGNKLNFKLFKNQYPPAREGYISLSDGRNIFCSRILGASKNGSRSIIGGTLLSQRIDLSSIIAR